MFVTNVSSIRLISDLVTSFRYISQFYVSTKLALVGLSIVPPVAMVAVVYGRYVRKITRQVQVR